MTFRVVDEKTAVVLGKRYGLHADEILMLADYDRPKTSSFWIIVIEEGLLQERVTAYKKVCEWSGFSIGPPVVTKKGNT